MRHHHSVALAGVIAVAATAGPAVAGPLTLVNYIAVPADAANMQPGGAFSAFDISYADPVTGDIFIADRSNASVDIFSGSSQTFLGRATGFTGQYAGTAKAGIERPEAAGNNIGVGSGWRPFGHLGRDDHHLRR
jgi:hypothetical protein